MNLRELAGDAKVIDVTVAESADSVGMTIRELSETSLLGNGFLIVAIERDDEVIMPNGDTEIKAGDLLTILAQHGEAIELSNLFSGKLSPNNSETQEEKYEM